MAEKNSTQKILKENLQPKDIKRYIIPQELLNSYYTRYPFLKNLSGFKICNISFWDDLIEISLSMTKKLVSKQETQLNKIDQLEKELKSKTVEHREHLLVDAIISLEEAGYVIKIEAIPNVKKETR